MTADEMAEVVDRFNGAWNAHDLDAALDLVTDDAVFESTGPAPDGAVHRGRDELREAWAPVFADPRTAFSLEEFFAGGDGRCVQRWRYDWGDGHVRGVDLLTLRDGRIAVKRSYVKG